MANSVYPQSERDPEPAVAEGPLIDGEADKKSSPKVAKIDLLLFALIGLLIQAGWAAVVSEPTYMDAY